MGILRELLLAIIVIAMYLVALDVFRWCNLIINKIKNGINKRYKNKNKGRG